MSDALERVRQFVNEPIAAGSSVVPIDADSARQHDRAGLCVSRADLRALCAEVERLREDAARLDWFVANYDEIEIGESERGWFASRDNGDSLYPIAAGLPTFRAAIDAARTTGGRENE